MIIENFHPGKVRDIYKRFDEKGRLLPIGLEYINSWIDENIQICFQVMKTDNKNSIHEWISNWKDLADFEIIPLLTSEQAKERVLSNED